MTHSGSFKVLENIILLLSPRHYKYFFLYIETDDNYSIILTWSKTLTTFFLSTETTCFDYCKKKRMV